MTFSETQPVKLGMINRCHATPSAEYRVSTAVNGVPYGSSATTGPHENVRTLAPTALITHDQPPGAGAGATTDGWRLNYNGRRRGWHVVRGSLRTTIARCLESRRGNRMQTAMGWSRIPWSTLLAESHQRSQESVYEDFLVCRRLTVARLAGCSYATKERMQIEEMSAQINKLFDDTQASIVLWIGAMQIIKTTLIEQVFNHLQLCCRLVFQ
jgi:hypothetical protein